MPIVVLLDSTLEGWCAAVGEKYNQHSAFFFGWFGAVRVLSVQMMI